MRKAADQMDMYRLSILLTITGTIGYHVCNKAVSPVAHPAMSLVATYLVALVVSVAVYVVDAGAWSLPSGAMRLNWASYALGIAVTLIELGFVLVYRSGWVLGTAQLTSTVGATLLLVPIGIVFFNERVAASNLAGILLSLVGMVLMSRR